MRDCARYTPDGRRFCPTCGTRVSQYAQACPVCHTRLDACPKPRAIPLWEVLTLLVVTALVWTWWTHHVVRVRAAERAFTATAAVHTRYTDTSTFTPTPTPSPTVTPTPTATATSTPTPVIYTVRPNDTLEGIAIQFGVPLKMLAQANRLDVDDILHVGQKLLIPYSDITPYPTPTPTPRTGIINYVVEKGDTLVLVAERFQISPEAIIQANKLNNSALLRPGMVLIIPLSTPVPTPTPTPIQTPTPTPGPRYPAPIPILPPDGAHFVGPNARVQLAWTAVGYLWPGEVYRVTLRVGALVRVLDTNAPQCVVPPTWYSDIVRAGGEVHWRVQVVDRTTTPPVPKSPPSVWRTFLWKSEE